MERKTKTSSGEIDESVRRAILDGRLRPAATLSPSVLNQEYGVSLSVVREELTRLDIETLALRRLAVTPRAMSPENIEQLMRQCKRQTRRVPPSVLRPTSATPRMCS